MKKIIALCLTLVLACSCIFAAKFSLTVGTGLGGTGLTKKAPREILKASGPTLFNSFDFETSFGLSAFLDTTFTFGTFQKAMTSKRCILSNDIGVGYTWNFGDFALMTGGGATIQIRTVRGKASDPIHETFGVLGLNTRLKGTYHFTEHWGLSMQFNSSLDFFEFSRDWKNTFKVFSWDTLIGCVFTI